MTELQWKSDFHWHWLRVNTGEISGKYLFFSKSVEALKAIAELECRANGFFLAKISKDANAGDHVLCLYWADDSRKHELAMRHSGNDDVRYRYWKSNEQTRRGEYSEHYLNSIN